MKVNVKGNNIKIEVLDNVFLSSNKSQILDGECDTLKGLIKINKNVDDYNLDALIIHELTHAYFFESGLPYYSSDETLVTWIGHNLKSIYNDFKKIKDYIKK